MVSAGSRTGCLSLYFDNVVVSGESVQAVVRRPGAGEDQSEVWARFADTPDMSVAHGTAGLGGRGVRSCPPGTCG